MKRLNPFSMLTAAVALEVGLSGVMTHPAIAQYAPDGYTNCRSVANSVVTLYAGTEIGSGSIINPSGLLLTNYHVVREAVQSRGQAKIFVKLANGNRYTGQAVASDPQTDLALVQFSPNESLTPIRFGSAESVRPGQKVCAIGSPRGQTGVLTQGTLAGFRSNNDLRSNLRLYGGNSGGPLLNDQGEMIGINKSIWLSDTGENTGISFAINVRTAQQFIEQARPGALNTAIARQPAPQLTPRPIIIPQPAPQLVPRPITIPQPAPQLTPRPVTPSQPRPVGEPALEPYLLPGMSGPTPLAPESIRQVPGSTMPAMQPGSSVPVALVQSPDVTGVAMTPKRSNGRLGVILDARNLEVRQVETGSAADFGGLRPGDRIVAINGRSIQKLDELQAFLQQRPSVGTFTVDRNNQTTSVQVKF